MVAIARGLMSKPKILMLDEPSVGLAPMIVKEIMGILSNLKAKGTIILLVEQNARAALKVADRVYVMERGRMVLTDTGVNYPWVRKRFLSPLASDGGGNDRSSGGQEAGGAFLGTGGSGDGRCLPK